MLRLPKEIFNKPGIKKMEQHETVWQLFNELVNFLNSEALQPYFALGSYIEATENINKYTNFGRLKMLNGMYFSKMFVLDLRYGANAAKLRTIDSNRISPQMFLRKNLNYQLALANLISAINLNIISVVLERPFDIQFSSDSDGKNKFSEHFRQQGYDFRTEELYSNVNHRCDLAVEIKGNLHYYELGTISDPWKIFAELWLRRNNFCIHIIPYTNEHFVLFFNE